MALNTTVVDPRGKTLSALLVITTELSTLSKPVALSKYAVIASVLVEVPEASVAATVIEAGAVITGPVTSLLTSSEAVACSEPD